MVATLQHPLPPPRPRKPLQKRAVGLRRRRGHDRGAVGRHDPLAAAAALESHRNPDHQRGALEPGLNGSPSRCPRRQLVALTQLPNQARQPLSPDPHLERFPLDIHPLDQELDDPRLLGGEQLAPDRGEISERERVGC
jgi:hypothetical protein